MIDSISLARGILHRIDSGRGTRIHVRSGELWVTQDGDTRDYIVSAGESVVLRRDGAAIASALAPSLITTSRVQPARGALARAWSAMLAPFARMA